MDIDLSAAAAFMAGHARVLDRRRFDMLLGQGHPDAVLGALDGYRNPDGGYGWGLEADLRSPESQPAAALHAFEVFEDLTPVVSPRAAELCDWLLSITLPDGGVPFARPLTIEAASAPWWNGADPGVPSLQITTITAAAAHRVAAHDQSVAAHPWLTVATDYCLNTIAALDEAPSAHVLAFAVRFLDAVYSTHPEAADLLAHLAKYVPADGVVPVEGGTEGESLRPLDFAPHPNTPARSLLAPDAIADDLVRLAGAQQPDGGWPVDWAHISPAGVLDWRGHLTLRAINLLRSNA